MKNPRTGGSAPGYLPRAGDEAMVFTHRFKKENYEEGKHLLVDEITAVIGGSGQTRRTYFLHSPDKSEFKAISFFHPDSTSKEWLANEEREAVMKKLQQHYRQPLEVQIFIVDEVHDTH